MGICSGAHITEEGAKSGHRVAMRSLIAGIATMKPRYDRDGRVNLFQFPSDTLLGFEVV